MTYPTYSLVICSHNYGHLAAHAIESALSQCFNLNAERHWYGTPPDNIIAPSTSFEKIYFVDAAYKADLKIFFVDAAYKAKWEDKSKIHLLY